MSSSTSWSLPLCCCGLRRKTRTVDESGAYAALGDEEREMTESRHDGAAGGYQPPHVSNSSKGRTIGRTPSGSSIPSKRSVDVPVPTMKDFKLLKCIGKGGFSKVLQVQHKETKVIYALKAVSKTMLKSPKEEERLLAEAQILRRIQHPFCITLQFSFQSPRELLYIFDFVPGGVLYHHLKLNRYFNEARARFYIAEIILALEYLHGLGIIYRDLKLENCLVAHDGHLRLTDFGAAKDLMGDSKTTTFCGTPCYIAPEILRGEQYDQSVDWWTTGIILYEMLVGKPPFTGSNRHSLYKNVLKAPIALPDRLSPATKDIIMQLLQRNPLSRLGGHMISRGDSASILKAHDFFYTPKVRTGTESSAAGTPTSPSLPMVSPIADAAAAGGRLAELREESSGLEDSMEESNVFDGVLRPTPRGSDNKALDSPNITGRVQRQEEEEKKKKKRKRLDCLEPNTWTWPDLEKKQVEPPWKPKLVSYQDTTYFDPIVTSEPVSLGDLPGTRGAPVRKDLINIADFDFAREQIAT